MNRLTCIHCGDTYPDFDVAHVCSRGQYAVKLKPKMNERIRELAEQARKHFPKTDTSGEFWVFDKEKFAELIVQECVHTVENRGGMCGALSSNWIKEHFGVEE